MEQLINRLNKLCNKLHNKFYINYGGCCYVTYLIAKHLDKLNIPYKLCVATPNELCIKQVQWELNNKIMNNDSNTSICGNNVCSHYYILIKDKIINGCDYDWYNMYTFNANHKIIRWIYKWGDWNDDYDVYNNRKVRNSINYLFKKYGRKEN